MWKIKKHLVDKKVHVCFISCPWININTVFLVSLCLGSLPFPFTECFSSLTTLCAGDEAQPHSEPDHASSVVLRLRQGGVPGA